MSDVIEEIWERHPTYPHEGSSLGRARTIKGKILTQRPNNTPKDATPDERYRLMDVWMPRPPCVLQPDGRWKHLPGARCKCRDTVSVHVFITECHWGLKKYRRQVARHRHGGSKADSSWENLLGWGFPEDNEMDKPPEVRSEAARKARETQLAASGPTATQRAAEYLQRVLADGPQHAGLIEAEALEVHGFSPQALWRARRDLGVTERRLWQLPGQSLPGVRYLPWSNSKRKARRITAGNEAITKPVTRDVS